jgi:tetratricopeptide (TPR) repeat protein
MTRFLVFLLSVASAMTVAGADSNAIAQAVRDLGAADHKTREAATQFLAKAGSAVIPELEQAAQNPDPEIRLRAAQLLPALRLALPADLPARLRHAVIHFNALNLDDQQATIRQLSEVGRPARPALLELARRERDLEKRVYLFDDLVESLALELKRRLRADKLDHDGAGRVVEGLELYQAIVPEDPYLPTLAVQKLDAAGWRARADQVFATTYQQLEKQCADLPGDPEPRNNLAWLCAVARRRLDDGLKHIEIGLQAAPRAAPLLDTKAELLFQKGQKAEALAWIEKTIELEPDTDYFQKQRDRFQKGDPSIPPPEPDHHDP